MGNIISARDFSLQNQTGLLKPIIYCCPYEGISEAAVPINNQLAKALLDFRPKRRTMQIEKCIADIIGSFPDGVVIKDFDVLFNPGYQVDLLKIMVKLCKSKPFSIVWPGTYYDGKLIYAEEGYQDYKTYNVSEYDITCIVQEERK